MMFDLDAAIYADYYAKGVQAFERGDDVTACPIVSPGDAPYEGWMDGWNASKSDAAEDDKLSDDDLQRKYRIPGIMQWRS